MMPLLSPPLLLIISTLSGLQSFIASTPDILRLQQPPPIHKLYRSLFCIPFLLQAKFQKDQWGSHLQGIHLHLTAPRPNTHTCRLHQTDLWDNKGTPGPLAAQEVIYLGGQACQRWHTNTHDSQWQRVNNTTRKHTRGAGCFHMTASNQQEQLCRLNVCSFSSVCEYCLPLCGLVTPARVWIITSVCHNFIGMILFMHIYPRAITHCCLALFAFFPSFSVSEDKSL